MVLKKDMYEELKASRELIYKECVLSGEVALFLL